MYRSKKNREGNVANRKYEFGINRHQEWAREKPKVKPDKSNFILTISRSGNSIKCIICGENKKLHDDFDSRMDRKVIQNFKAEHSHKEE